MVFRPRGFTSVLAASDPQSPQPPKERSPWTRGDAVCLMHSGKGTVLGAGGFLALADHGMTAILGRQVTTWNFVNDRHQYSIQMGGPGLGVTVGSCNPSPGEVEAGGSGLEGGSGRQYTPSLEEERERKISVGDLQRL